MIWSWPVVGAELPDVAAQPCSLMSLMNFMRSGEIEMRIIQLIPQTVLGGAESYGFTLATEFARRGHQVLLLANRSNGPLLEREASVSVRAARPLSVGDRGGIRFRPPVAAG